MSRVPRYFATVRRATGKPSFLRSSESFSSEYGHDLSSASTIAYNRALTASVETCSPESVVTPDVKNFLSSTTPFGVEMYLSRTVRETVVW